MWLNNIDVLVTDTAVFTSTMQQVPVNRTFLYVPNKFIIIELKNTIMPGNYHLQFQYIGTVGFKGTDQIFATYPISENETR